jgi:hypothetical protein
MRAHVAILALLLLPASVALAQDNSGSPAEDPSATEALPPEAKPLPDPGPPAEPTPATQPSAEEEQVPEETPPLSAESVGKPQPATPPVTEQPDAEQEPQPDANAEAEVADQAEESAPKKAKSALVKPSPRQGHYIALGLHGVSGYANDRDRGGRGPAFGAGYSLRLGERVTSWLDLGIALAYASVGGDDPWAFGRLTVHAQVYVNEHYFVHGGFGFGAAGGNDPEDPGFSRGRFGDVYTAGAGRNFYLSDSSKSGGWIVTPVVTAEYGRDDQFPNAGLWVGVEISRWWGISRNQLDLSFDEAYK